jgi:hypothetical protein
MSIDGSEETSGIKLFSRPSKKAKKNNNGASDAPPPEFKEQSTRPSCLDEGKQSIEGVVSRGPTAASTNGCQKSMTGFRSLGISDWLDR